MRVGCFREGVEKGNRVWVWVLMGGFHTRIHR